MNIEMIRETGGSRRGTLSATYSEIVSVVGSPNVTDMDDEYKVKASWGFQDSSTGRKGFVWCYKYLILWLVNHGVWTVLGNYWKNCFPARFPFNCTLSIMKEFVKDDQVKLNNFEFSPVFFNATGKIVLKSARRPNQYLVRFNERDEFHVPAEYLEKYESL